MPKGVSISAELTQRPLLPATVKEFYKNATILGSLLDELYHFTELLGVPVHFVVIISIHSAL